MKMAIWIMIGALGMSAMANAGSRYTGKQLMAMVKSGQYPPQGEVTTTTKSISFPACVAAVNNITGQVKGLYPVKTIASTSQVYLVKLWTNDAAMTLTCSQPDKKLVITQAPYI